MAGTGIYAHTSAVADVYGGTDFLVEAVGIPAQLTAAGFTDVSARIELDDSEENQADVVKGWHRVTPSGGTAEWRLVGLSTFAEQVASDISRLKSAVQREVEQWEKVLAKEAISPHTDSGHLLSDDVIHALFKPWMRVHVLRLTTAKATPNAANITAYKADLDRFVLLADLLGADGVYDQIALTQAVKTEWRGNRSGLVAYRYDAADGGILRDAQNDPVGSVAVTYPGGDTVATWDAIGAVEAL